MSQVPAGCDPHHYATMIREFEALGVELRGLHPVTSGTFTRPVEIACVMVASRFADAGRVRS